MEGQLGERPCPPLLLLSQDAPTSSIFSVAPDEGPTGNPWGMNPLPFPLEVLLGAMLPSGASQINNMSH